MRVVIDGIEYVPADSKAKAPPKPKVKDEGNKLRERFNAVWTLYNKKGNRATAFQKYIRLTIKQREQMHSKVLEYVTKKPDLQFRLNLETYLHKDKERWNDKVIETSYGTRPMKPAANAPYHGVSKIDKVAEEAANKLRESNKGSIRDRLK